MGEAASASANERMPAAVGLKSRDSMVTNHEPRTTHTLRLGFGAKKKQRKKERKESLRVTKLRNDISSIHDPHFPRTVV